MPTARCGDAKALNSHTQAVLLSIHCGAAIAKQGRRMGKAAWIFSVLEREIPEQKREDFLLHKNAFQLLVAVMLSRQSIDKNANTVTPHLFDEASTPHAMVRIGAKRIEDMINTVGLVRSKSKYIVATCRLLLEKHGGDVPATEEDLRALPGVGRKTAAVVLSDSFSQRKFPVDRQIRRLEGRWGIGDGRSVVQTELNLREWLAEMPNWGSQYQRKIIFVRQVFKAMPHRIADCSICSFPATEERCRAEATMATTRKPSDPYIIFSTDHARKRPSKLPHKDKDKDREKDKDVPSNFRADGRTNTCSVSLRIFPTRG